MIYLYKNILPNYADNTHFVFNTMAEYVASLGEAFTEINDDKYTLNDNSVRIQIDNDTDADAITYIAWVKNDVWRFYYVRNTILTSGYALYTTEIDLWATYYAQAVISNIKINRCNRNVGGGVYDNIPVTQGREFIQLGDDLTTNDLAIVYVVAFATGVSSILVNNAGTALGVFVNEMLPDENKPDDVPLIDWYINLVSGIYSAVATIGDLDANVLKAYIVPKDVVAIKSGTVPVFNVKSPSFSGTMTPSYEAAPYIYPKRFEFNVDPNNKYFVGTKHAGVELARVTSTAEVFYNFIVKQDGLQVIVQQGDKQLEITDAFQVGLTSNDGNLTASQQIARTLQTVGGIASGAFQIIAGGAGYVTGALSVVNALQGVIEQGNAKYSQGGDGVSTFRLLSGEGTTPFYMQTNTSIDDEGAHARLFGAVFNQQVSDINTIFESALLGTGTLSDTYIVADLRVNGIPLEACEVITNKFKNGVYIQKL